MNRMRRVLWPKVQQADHPGSMLGFGVAAILVGSLTGLMAASFRVLLEWLAEARTGMVGWAHLNPVVGFIVVVTVCSGATALAAALVHRVEPHAEGSGIPRVEAVVEGRIPPGRPLILPVKYVGGLLSIGAGLALGREGPSVQMGGNIGIIAAHLTRRNSYDLRILVAAGAAAGLATAFNAPLAGGVFVLEELIRRFDPRATVATLLASSAGFATAALVTGDLSPLFLPASVPAIEFSQWWAVLIAAVLAGLAGLGYNWLLLGGLRLADASKLPREARAALIGAAVGVVAYAAPGLVGGGDNLTGDALRAQGTILTVAGVLVARVLLGVMSYAAGTPGGIFAPMLVVGSHVGLLVGFAASSIAPQWAPHPASLALIGIAAFFTASVRAPLTGLVLATELTGVTNQYPPLLGACAVAMLLSITLRATPIYDALTARAAWGARQNAQASDAPGT